MVVRCGLLAIKKKSAELNFRPLRQVTLKCTELATGLKTMCVMFCNFQNSFIFWKKEIVNVCLQVFCIAIYI